MTAPTEQALRRAREANQGFCTCGEEVSCIRCTKVATAIDAAVRDALEEVAVEMDERHECWARRSARPEAAAIADAYKDAAARIRAKGEA